MPNKSINKERTDSYRTFRENLAPSLIDINIETLSCERIGIVGRTGAGKSSILSGSVFISVYISRWNYNLILSACSGGTTK